MAIIFDERGRPITEANPFPVTGAVQLSGSSQDLRGKLTNRPVATAVDAGTTYWAIDRIGQTDEVTVSDGATWTNL